MCRIMFNCNIFGTIDDSMNSPSSKTFMMKAIVLLTIICVPGNVITSILVYTHCTSRENSIEQHQNYSSVNENDLNDTGLDDEIYSNVSYLVYSTYSTCLKGKLFFKIF